MGKMKYIVSFCAVGLCALLPMVHADAKEVKVSDGTALQNAIANAENGDVITLEQSITLNGKVELTSGVEVTIDGANHTITGNRAATGSVTDNITLITASLNGSKINLKNVTLKDSPKYGVQAYNGGYVSLQNVTIENCKYGAVLVNGGTVEVISLNLGYNGENSNNGIELSKSQNIVSSPNQPTVVMNGTLTSTETENVIRFAEDENDATTEVVIENAETTTDKVFVNDSKLVVTDNAGEVKYESNEAADITVDGDEYVEPSEPTTPTTPEETPSTGDTTEEVTNPETSDSVLLIVAGLIISAAAGTFAMKQLKNHA